MTSWPSLSDWPLLLDSDPGSRAGAQWRGCRTTSLEAVAKAGAAGLTLDDPAGAAVAFDHLAESANRLPLPGGGRTWERFAGLASIAAVDVTLGRLIEAHTDALAILAELADVDSATITGQRWGVWAAEGPQSTLTARKSGDGPLLSGVKPWCSGAGICSDALVTAQTPHGRRLFAVALKADVVRLGSISWQGLGMTGSSTESVEFFDAPATPVAQTGQYLTRRGFWGGAIGVAALWWGAAVGIADPLYEAARSGGLGPHALAHLGAVHASLASGAAVLEKSAASIDRAGCGVGEGEALTARAVVETAADDVIRRVGRALGPGRLCLDREHARRVADLTLYLRQSHAERDLARIGELTAHRLVPGAGGDGGDGE